MPPFYIRHELTWWGIIREERKSGSWRGRHCGVGGVQRTSREKTVNGCCHSFVETGRPGGLLSLFHFVFRREYFRIHGLAGVLTQWEDVCVYKVSMASIFFPFLFLSDWQGSESTRVCLLSVLVSSLLTVYPRAGFYRAVTRWHFPVVPIKS